MEHFTVKVIKIISSIPEGKVMTYGQIAELAGNHRAARQVARILHALTDKYELPWHRVINAKGEISFGDYETQKEMLMEEGVEFKGTKTLQLEHYLHMPALEE